MLRWLKDKKKTKKCRTTAHDDYGFNQQQQQHQHPHPRERANQVDGFDEKIYHIYEEIPDIPTPVPGQESLDVSFPPERLVDPHRGQRSRDGPYMVVPIIGSQSQEAAPLDQETRSAFSLVESECRTAFNCAVIGRRRSSDHGSLTTSSEHYEFTTSGSSDGGRGSFSDVPEGLPPSAHAQSPPQLPARPWETLVPPQVTSSGGGQSGPLCGSAPDPLCHAAPQRSSKTPRTSELPPGQHCSCCSAHARERSNFRDCDSCYEYDVSTSSESDQYNYEFYLSKVEENLMMKHKVQKIIMSMEKTRQKKCAGPRSRHGVCREMGHDSDEEGTICQAAKLWQLQLKSRRSHHCEADSDDGTLADQSESENSSGYYESFSLADGALAPGLQPKLDSCPHAASRGTTCCRGRSRETSHQRERKCERSCKCAAVSRKAPLCGVRSLGMSQHREKSSDNACCSAKHREISCTRATSRGDSCGDAKSREEGSRRSCSRERGLSREDVRVADVEGYLTTRREETSQEPSKPMRQRSRVSRTRQGENTAKDATVGEETSSAEKRSGKDARPSPSEATSSSSRKGKGKHGKSSHRKHRHRSCSKSCKASPTTSDPSEGVDGDCEDRGSNPGEGLDTREVEEEDSEVYTPPPSVSDFTSRVPLLQPKIPCKPWKQDATEIYRSRSSSNRLLSDLIVSNYDRQLFVRV